MVRLFLISFFSFACHDFNKSKNESRIDASLLRGTWQYCDKHEGYKLMELSDSIYYYVDHGEYVGPYIPGGYTISEDTLAWTYEDGTMDESNRWQIKKLDTAVLILKNKTETIIAQKVKLSTLLSDYEYRKREEYINQYKIARKQFNCQ